MDYSSAGENVGEQNSWTLLVWLDTGPLTLENNIPRVLSKIMHVYAYTQILLLWYYFR